jgi:hypothetical protein
MERTTIRIAAATPLLLLLGGCIFGDCDGDDAPEPVACEGSVDDDAVVDELAIGSGEPFVPLADGDPTEVEVGFQGSPMLKVYAAWRADAAPTCGKVRVRLLRVDGSEYVSLEEEVTSTEQAPWRLGSTFYFIVEEGWGDTVTVEVQAFDRTVSRRVQVGGWAPEADAGSDAGGDSGSSDAAP